MKNRRRIASLAVIAAALFSSVAVSQLDVAELIEEMRSAQGADAWTSDRPGLIAGVAVSASTVPQLEGFDAIWPDPMVSAVDVLEHRYAVIQQRWISGESEVEIEMAVTDSFDGAVAYLLYRHALTEVGVADNVWPTGASVGLAVGDAALVLAEEEGDTFIAIDFIRNNTVFLLRAAGEAREMLRSIAEHLDALLVAQTPVPTYEDLPDLPHVFRLCPQQGTVYLGQTTSLILDVESPGDRALYFIWTLSGGGIEGDDPAGFAFQGTTLGTCLVRLTVINSLGLYVVAETEVEVMAP